MQCSVADSPLLVEEDELSWPHIREHAWTECLPIQIPAWIGDERKSGRWKAAASQSSPGLWRNSASRKLCFVSV
jgi:hypothetical protein